MGDAGKTAELLAAGADASATNQYSISMAHTAAGTGNLDVLQLLILHNASVDAQLDGPAGERAVGACPPGRRARPGGGGVDFYMNFVSVKCLDFLMDQQCIYKLMEEQLESIYLTQR